MFFPPTISMAVKVAPRISDREIVERLTRLEEGQKSLNRRVDDLRTEINQRFEAMESKMDQRFAAMESKMDQRFAAMETQNNRIWNLMLVIIAGIMGLIAAIVGLIGYIMWDRKTTLHPLEQRFSSLEGKLNEELELDSEHGSLPRRLVQALCKYASKETSLKEILRSLSLL